MIDVVLLSGAVGVGKTTTAEALSGILREHDVAHALIDLDGLRQAFPAPADDPFHLRLSLANLAAVASNDRAAGCGRLVLAGVIESREERDRHARAVGAGGMLLCRLVAEQSSVDARITGRGATADRLRWELARSRELADLQQAAAVDDLVLDTTGLDPDGAARIVARAAGWLT